MATTSTRPVAARAGAVPCPYCKHPPCSSDTRLRAAAEQLFPIPPQPLSRAMPWQRRSCRHSEQGPGGSSGREAFPGHSRHPSGHTQTCLGERLRRGQLPEGGTAPRHSGAIVAHDRCQSNGSRSNFESFSTRCPAPILAPWLHPSVAVVELRKPHLGVVRLN